MSTFEDKLRARECIFEDTLAPVQITISRKERYALTDAIEALRIYLEAHTDCRCRLCVRANGHDALARLDAA